MTKPKELKEGDRVKIVSLPDEEWPGIAPRMELMVGNKFSVVAIYDDTINIQGHLWERRNLRKLPARREARP